MELMKAAVFRGPGTIEIEERKKPVTRAGEAVIRVTTTTICGTDVHIVKGEYPVKPGLILGHEPVGIIESLGDGNPAARRTHPREGARAFHQSTNQRVM